MKFVHEFQSYTNDKLPFVECLPYFHIFTIATVSAFFLHVMSCHVFRVQTKRRGSVGALKINTPQKKNLISVRTFAEIFFECMKAIMCVNAAVIVLQIFSLSRVFRFIWNFTSQTSPQRN